jgi:hypothetical protein
MKRLFAVLALAACFPAAAQVMTGTLKVQGDVRIASTGSDFVAAADDQPVVAGQRILVGENASAKVRYGQDCVLTYSDPGVYTIGAADCRRDKHRKGEDEQDQAQDGLEGGGGSLAGTLGTILGTVLAGQQVLEHQDERKPDRALSH